MQWVGQNIQTCLCTYLLMMSEKLQKRLVEMKSLTFWSSLLSLFDVADYKQIIDTSTVSFSSVPWGGALYKLAMLLRKMSISRQTLDRLNSFSSCDELLAKDCSTPWGPVLPEVANNSEGRVSFYIQKKNFRRFGKSLLWIWLCQWRCKQMQYHEPI